MPVPHSSFPLKFAAVRGGLEIHRSAGGSAWKSAPNGWPATSPLCKEKADFPPGTLPANRRSDTITDYYNRKVSKIKEESLDKPYENKNLPPSGEGNSAAGPGRTRSIYIISISSNNTRFCSSERVAHFANNARCSSVNSIGSFPSEKNCARVIPNALQIASNVYSVGTLFLLNKLLIVDCGRFAIFANLYSLHPRSSISSRMCC